MAPEELAEPGAQVEDKPRAPFGPSVWFSVSTGRNEGAEPRTLLPMLCRLGDLTKDDIGAIRIQPSHSFVEIQQAAVARFVAALGPEMKVEMGAVVTQLDSPPDVAQGSKAPPKRGPKPAPRAERAPRPAYDPDAPSAPRTPRPPRDAEAEGASPVQAAAAPRAPRAEKPAFDKPRAPKGARPPKSHKTERSPMKPGATPKPKSGPKGDAPAKPKAKAVARKGARRATPV